MAKCTYANVGITAGGQRNNSVLPGAFGLQREPPDGSRFFSVTVFLSGVFKDFADVDFAGRPLLAFALAAVVTACTSEADT